MKIARSGLARRGRQRTGELRYSAHPPQDVPYFFFITGHLWVAVALHALAWCTGFLFAMVLVVAASAAVTCSIGAEKARAVTRARAGRSSLFMMIVLLLIF